MTIFKSKRQKVFFKYWLELAKMHKGAYRKICLGMCRKLVDPNLKLIAVVQDEYIFESVHAKHSPSSSERWLKCPSAVKV